MKDRRILRVFPRSTKATPVDNLAFVGFPPVMVPEAEEVHISVTFTEDIQRGKELAYAWRHFGEVRIGGPALNNPGGEFVPGRYLKTGYTITSRGCPNNCWYCDAWKREGRELRLLPIRDGWDVLDNNLLACPDKHTKAVFEMLLKQPERPRFSGGLEAARLKLWHVDWLDRLKPSALFFAYDKPESYEPLCKAGKMLTEIGLCGNTRKARCYVLIGFRGDTVEKAEERLWQAWDAGFMPFAMLYNRSSKSPRGWKQFQRSWVAPQAIATQAKQRRKRNAPAS